MLSQIIEWFKAQDPSTWAGIAAAFVLFFDRLSKITPTQSDNKAVQFLRKVFTFLGVRVPDVQ